MQAKIVYTQTNERKGPVAHTEFRTKSTNHIKTQHSEKKKKQKK